MQKLTTRLITQEIEQNSIERYELRMVLRPSTLNFREQFRNNLQNQLIRNSDSRLTGVSKIEDIDAIDSQDIIEINNQTSSERIIEFLQNVINYENINDNSHFLIANSSNQVRTYLNDLLIRSASIFPINEDDLYRVRNIFLYTIANIDVENVNLRDVIQHLRAHMVIFNTEQIVNILENHIPTYNTYLENFRLLTDEQLEERTQKFYQEIEEQVFINRQRILYAGIGLVGLPPLGGVLTRIMSNLYLNEIKNYLIKNPLLMTKGGSTLLKQLNEIDKLKFEQEIKNYEEKSIIPVKNFNIPEELTEWFNSGCVLKL